MCYSDEEDCSPPFQFLTRKLPQFKEVEVFSEYNPTDQFPDKALKDLFRLLDKGSIDVVRLYLRWGNWKKALFRMDLPSEYGIHAMLADLGLDPAKLEPDSYVEVLQGEGKDKDLRDECSTNFYSGTAFADRRGKGEKVQLVRIYQTPKNPTKAESNGNELLDWDSEVEASGDSKVEW